jgi:hypothetical protein
MKWIIIDSYRQCGDGSGFGLGRLLRKLVNALQMFKEMIMTSKKNQQENQQSMNQLPKPQRNQNKRLERRSNIAGNMSAMRALEYLNNRCIELIQ